MKYLVVIHSWFVGSQGWKVHTITAEDDTDAREQAIVLKHERENTSGIDHCSFNIIPLAEGVRPRRLTFKERLFGEIDAS